MSGRIPLRLIAALLAVQVGGLPAAAADRPLTGAEFEAMTTGRTLTYAQGGQVYGVEQYKPGRRVTWAFTGDDCQEGIWYEEGSEICFVYEGDGRPQCWQFLARPGGLVARFRGDPPGSELSVVAETTDPMLCAGPDVGA